MRVLLFQVDGKFPNFALMRLSTWHRGKGDDVTLLKHGSNLWFAEAERVYSSSIFTSSKPTRDLVAQRFPEAIVGGDGYFPIWNDLTVIGRNKGSNLTEVIKDVNPDSLLPDYSHYPQFTASLGYSQRGCRLDCDFCRMQTREGLPRSVSTLNGIWRGEPFPKHLLLLDNDFFGQKNWHDLLNEAIEGQFKVCFNQGINIRLITGEQAAVLSKVYYSDDSFKTRRLYTAWDNLGDEDVFRKGVRKLEEVGIPAKHLMVYMLIGKRPEETEEEVLYRFNEMKLMGCLPYPMVFDRSRLLLCRFQKWVIRRYHEVCTWEEFKEHHESRPGWN
jgi:hypothetical protein